SPKMRAIFDLIQTVAPQTSRVLITGESGTGKELVARAIHENSQRSQAPFITINCGAFPETLLESELFGYMKGAFTGANEKRQGLFQAAHGGTLFMDEIGNMTLTMQVKLYRVLQEGKVRPLGSNDEVDVDVRVIAATNKEFEKEISEGRFREDLYYRLSVIPIQLPSLRERKEDIPLLARHFLERFRRTMEKPVEGISPEAIRSGSNDEVDVDVRVIAATNKEFEKEISEGRFREDLYYRLSVIPIQLPSLRERKEDIPLLARHFLERFRRTMEKPVEGISPEAIRKLESYDWPGNVRELENTMERAVALETTNEISLRVLPDRIAGYASTPGISSGLGTAAFPEGGVDFEKEIADTERRYLLAALEKAGGVRTRASEL